MQTTRIATVLQDCSPIARYTMYVLLCIYYFVNFGLQFAHVAHNELQKTLDPFFSPVFFLSKDFSLQVNNGTFSTRMSMESLRHVQVSSSLVRGECTLRNLLCAVNFFRMVWNVARNVRSLFRLRNQLLIGILPFQTQRGNR